MSRFYPVSASARSHRLSRGSVPAAGCGESRRAAFFRNSAKAEEKAEAKEAQGGDPGREARSGFVCAAASRPAGSVPPALVSPECLARGAPLTAGKKRTRMGPEKPGRD
jgi:hypothetical protein